MDVLAGQSAQGRGFDRQGMGALLFSFSSLLPGQDRTQPSPACGGGRRHGSRSVLVYAAFNCASCLTDLKKRGEPQRPEDLLEHDCILYTLLNSPREWRLTGDSGQEHVVPIKGPLHSNNGLVNREVALAGAGIVMLPTFYIGDQLRAGELKPVLCRFKPAELGMHAVYPERRNLSPKVRAFVDFLAQKSGGEPPWDRGLEVTE